MIILNYINKLSLKQLYFIENKTIKIKTYKKSNKHPAYSLFHCFYKVRIVERA